MVRWLGMLLVLTLLLCGCAAETVPTTTPTDNTIESTLPTEPPGLYVPQSKVEVETHEAVRQFLTEGEYQGCITFGDDLLLLGKTGGVGELSLYSGDRLELVKTVSLGAGVFPLKNQIQISQRGIGYFDNVDHAMVFLDIDLREIGRMHLGEEFSGNAWLCPDWKAVYFCKENGIYTMDLQSGITRMLKEQRMPYQEITGILGNGEVLRCTLGTEEESRTLLVDTASGMVLGEGAHLDQLLTWQNTYFFPQQTGLIHQLRFGDDQSHKVLWPAEKEAKPYWLPNNRAIVMAQAQENQMTLTYYSLENGSRRATVTMKDMTEIWGLEGDGKGGVWLFGRHGDKTETLYHWNPARQPMSDNQIYIAPFYTQEQPDEERLAELSKQAMEMAEQFGVEVLLWKDAVETAPLGHVFREEYLSQVYEHYLLLLEQALEHFPEGFFADSKLKIALVKDITGDPQWGELEKSTNLQFWQGEIPVLALVMGENFEQHLYHGLAHLIDTRVLSKSSALYEWNRQNPEGFVYDNSYITNLDREDTAYIEGENRYFIDLFSMSYAKEDRARIFEYACMEGNEEYFTSPVLQEKLRRICKGIREAYGLKKVEDTFLWEQYLTKK